MHIYIYIYIYNTQAAATIAHIYAPNVQDEVEKYPAIGLLRLQQSAAYPTHAMRRKTKVSQKVALYTCLRMSCRVAT